MRLAQVVRDLELNQRQREETVEVFAAIRDALGASRFAAWRELDGALESTAAEAFDKVGVEISLTGLGAIPEPARKTVVDGLEHLHNILTPGAARPAALDHPQPRRSVAPAPSATSAPRIPLRLPAASRIPAWNPIGTRAPPSARARRGDRRRPARAAPR